MTTGALTPENTGGSCKSLFGRLLGLLGDDLSYRHLWAGGAYGKVIASTRNPVITVFTGAAAAGGCVLTNANAGDIVISVIQLNGTPADVSASFESTISVTGQIQQLSASNLSANQYLVNTRPQS